MTARLIAVILIATAFLGVTVALSAGEPRTGYATTRSA